MPDNLVYFDLKIREQVRAMPIGGERTNPQNHALQLELFSPRNSFSNHFAILDLSWFDELSLTQLIIKNDVSVVIDLRQKPVFSKPKFNHKHVVNFFENCAVEYFEYAFLKIEFNRSFSKFRKVREIRNRIMNGTSKGMMLCLYEESIERQQYVSDFRLLVNGTNRSWVELVPSALLR